MKKEVTKTVIIKDWFARKLDLPVGIKMFKDSKLEVFFETEKAFKGYVECYSVDGEWEGVREVWVPKSCTMTEEEAVKEASEKAEKKAAPKKTAQKKSSKKQDSDMVKLFKSLSDEERMDYVEVNGRKYVRAMAAAQGLI